MTIPMPPMMIAAAALLLAHAALAMIDGVYIHLWRLRLFARPASWREHLWHTVRAGLYPVTLVLVFARPTAGATLWLGVAVLVIDQVVELLDVLSERASRAALGGLSSGEYAVHAVLVALRAAATALTLAARPAAAWAFDATSDDRWRGTLAWMIDGLVPGALAIAALHVALAWRHRPRLVAAAGLAA